MLVKPKLNRTEVLISKALIDSNISHDEFVLKNNVLKEYNDMKKNLKILIINKYVWCNKGNINIRKIVHWNLL